MLGHPPPMILFFVVFLYWCHPWRWHPSPSAAFIFVVSDRAWPLSDEGHQTLSTVHRWLATKIPAVAGGGRRRRHPRPSNSLLHPWKCYLRTPSLARLDVYLSWAIALRGRQIPAWRHDVIGGEWKDILEVVNPWAAKSVCWRWMVGGLGKMTKVASRRRATNPPPVLA